jgi:hypothetical protein
MLQEILILADSWNPDGHFDFVGLHNISKHVSHLVESAKALLVIVQSVIQQSTVLPNITDPIILARTMRELSIYHGMIHSVNLRLENVEKRLQNVINLVSAPVKSVTAELANSND